MDNESKQLVEQGRYMSDPVAVERKDLERLADAFGEIGLHLPWLREQVGPCADELTCVMEAQVEGAGLVRRMLGRCFNPDRSFLEDVCDAIEGENSGASEAAE